MRKYLNKYAKFSFSGLLETVRTGDISGMQDLLHDKDTLGYKNLNVNGFLYDSPLHEAVDRGDIDVCRMLLQSNADVNKLLADRTPLNIAEEMGHYQIAKLLIEKRNQDQFSYRNPLHIAVKECDYRLCKFHLKSINVNSLDERKQNALHVAVKYAPYDLCELLIKTGANVFSRDDFGDTPLQLAYYLGRHELREFALNYFSNEV